MIPAGTFAYWLKSSPKIEQCGWTLLHSIWEFAAVAGGLALVLRVFGDASSRARYLAATIALAMMLVLPIFTFQIIAEASVPPRGSAMGHRIPFAIFAGSVEASAESVTGKSPETVALPQTRASWPIRAADRIVPAIPWMTPAWCVGVLALGIWNLGGWIATQRLRSLGISSVDPELAGRLSRLAVRAGVRGPVRMAKSGLAQIPIVIGFVHPLILIPISVLAGLPPVHLEAILAHELAHIRRQDYLVNLFQVLVETLLFYHPAIWWVSRQIRMERENCCDDIAASVCGDRRLYAEALISVEELRPPANSLAVAATGGGDRMFGRIHRLIGRPRRSSNRQSASLAAVLLSLGVLLVPLVHEWVSAQVATMAAEAAPNSPAVRGQVMDSGILSVATLHDLGTPNSALIAEFPYVVDFVPYSVSWGEFSSGDGIIITSVRGDRKHIEPGGRYLVEGVYALYSMERASIGLSVTVPSRDSPGARSKVNSEQRVELSQGVGRFLLRDSMQYPGSFHLSFTPIGGGESRGTVYFREGPVQALQAGRTDVTSHPFNIAISPDSLVSVKPPPKPPPLDLDRNPLAGFEKQEGDSPVGFGANVANSTDRSKPSPDYISGTKDAPLTQNLHSVSSPQTGPTPPQSGRHLDQNARNFTFSKNGFGNRNIGPTAVDARWSNYGVYLERMIETVQIEWDRTLAASKIYPNSSSAVSVKFVMNTKGDVARIVSVEPTAGTSDAAARACVNAIIARAPYGNWTDEMTAVLGPEQEMTFTFYFK